MTTNLHIIVGLGASGYASAKYLDQKKIPYMVMDTRESPPNLNQFKQNHPNIEVITGELNTSLFDVAHTIVLSPGISLKTKEIAYAIQKGINVIGDIELFAKEVKKPIIAITGTNAKSTVTTLVAEMLKAANIKMAVGGNLGVPALDLIEDDIDAYVLELSSFQLETTSSLKAKVATILNVTSDHMDRYENIAEYQTAKLKIYDGAEICVSNLDDPLTFASKTDIWFTNNKPSQNTFGFITKADKTFLGFEDEVLLALDDLPVKGRHYALNALSALALGYGFGLPMQSMLKVLTNFKGLPHRCQFVREINGVKWFNDSKGTNVGATLAAIEGLGPDIQGKLVLIAGGLGKNADFSPLFAPILKYCRHLVLIGEAAKEFYQLFHKSIPCTYAETMEQAVVEALKVAKPGDSVLLSPACASFDMFKHFEHRGDVFMEAVKQLC